MASPPKKEHKLKLVVIGNGMTSYGFAKELVSLGAIDKLELTIIGEEPRPAYDRVHLTELFSGKNPEDLLLATADWYAEHGIELITEEKINSIDRGNHKLIAESGKEFSYDQCVLATGSKPFVPPIEGAELPKVFVYRTVEDLAKIRECAKSCQSAAVMGGGLLGLEAAKALYDLGLKTEVFEMAPALMPRQLDADCGALLKKEIESLGVQIHLLRKTERISQIADQLEIGFENHDSISTDMLVISAGIHPRDELAKESGLECGPRGGIAIDEHLQTNDPCVYSIGECAAYQGKIYGLVGPCYKMAQTLAQNISDMINGIEFSTKFEGASEAAQLKLMGVEVSTLGTPIGQQDDCVLITKIAENASRTLMLQRRRVVGAIGVGPWPEREQISNLITTRKKVSSRQISRFQETAQIWHDHQPISVADWEETATVCSCLNISRGTLTAAIQQEHCDLESLAAITGASTVCGSCKPLLCSLLGAPAGVAEVVGWKTLLAASLIATTLVTGYFIVGPVPFADSVQSTWHDYDFLWRESIAKQITGFTLLGISVIGLLLSLRKRLNWFNFGDYGFWRSMHGVLGTLTIVGFFVHTGMHLGSNFTFALAIVFLALNVLGSVTGIFAALESKTHGDMAQHIRLMRPRLAKMHIWLFWPLPILILFHVISVYYY